MTTTADLRAYLDARGVDGAPTEPGWYLVKTPSECAIVLAHQLPTRLAYAIGGEGSGRYCLWFDIVRHAPLTLAQPAGRDLDAEVVAGVQATREM